MIAPSIIQINALSGLMLLFIINQKMTLSRLRESEHFPPGILPRTDPSWKIIPPFLHGVRHLPLLPPLSANLQCKAIYR